MWLARGFGGMLLGKLPAETEGILGMIIAPPHVCLLKIVATPLDQIAWK